MLGQIAQHVARFEQIWPMLTNTGKQLVESGGGRRVKSTPKQLPGVVFLSGVIPAIWRAMFDHVLREVWRCSMAQRSTQAALGQSNGLVVPTPLPLAWGEEADTRQGRG